MTGLLFFAMFAAWPLFAADDQSITVKSSSVDQKVVLIDASIAGKPVQLECFLSASHCVAPEPGEYLMVKLPAGTGVYMDCPNIDLYKKPPDPKSEHKIGEYCLLEN